MRARALLILAVLACGCAPSPSPRGVPPAARFVLSIETHGANRSAVIRAEGAYDRTHAVYELAMTSTAISMDAAPTRIVVTPDAAYVEFPALARRLGATTPWLRVAGRARSAPELELRDPASWLEGIVRGSDQVETGPGGLVRRAVMRFDSPASEGSVVVTVTYSDQGAPVTIVPPPASETTDVTDALLRLVARRNGG